MNRFISTVAIAAILSGGASANPGVGQTSMSTPVAAEAPTPWQPEDGAEIRFDVFRKGDTKFGSHVVRFDVQDDGSYTVTTDVDLKAGLGPITVFRYTLDSTETWRDSQLVALEGKTNDDGDKEKVSVSMNGDALAVRGSAYSGKAPAGIIPSSHWNIQQVFSNEILSTENGKLLQTSIERVGEETLTIDGKAVPATHYRLKSDITVDLWYDDQNRWVQLSFEARGQTIDYKLASLY